MHPSTLAFDWHPALHYPRFGIEERLILQGQASNVCQPLYHPHVPSCEKIGIGVEGLDDC